MGDITGISWTDRTHNEWWGCSSKAGAGCDRCYAAVLDRRTGGNYFGIGTSPRLTKEQNRNKLHKGNREAEAAGKHVWVFCGSMMDFFDFTGEKFVNDYCLTPQHIGAAEAPLTSFAMSPAATSSRPSRCAWKPLQRRRNPNEAIWERSRILQVSG